MTARREEGRDEGEGRDGLDLNEEQVISAVSREFIMRHDRRPDEGERERKKASERDKTEARRARALRTFDLSIYIADNRALSLMCALPMATRDLSLAAGLQLRPEAA